MTVVDVYSLQKEKISEVELRDDIFDVPIKKTCPSPGCNQPA